MKRLCILAFILCLACVRAVRQSDQASSGLDLEEGLSLEEQLEAIHRQHFSSQEGVSLGTQARALLATADHFFWHDSVKELRSEAMSMPIAKELEQLGWPLATRFRHFALRVAMQRETSEDLGQTSLLEEIGAAAESDSLPEEEDLPEEEEESESPADVLSKNGRASIKWTGPSSASPQKEKIEGRSRTKMWQTAGRKVMITTAVEDCSAKELDKDLQFMRFAMKVNGTRHENARAALKNFCLLNNKIREAKSKKEAVEGLEYLTESNLTLAGRAEINSMEATRRGKFGDKKQWYQLRAAHHSRWLQKLGITKSSKFFQEIKQIHTSTILVNMQLSQLSKSVTAAMEVPWLAVRKTTNAKKIFRWTLKYPLNYLKQVGTNTVKFFTQLFHSFISLLRQGSKKCESDSKARSMKAAKAAGLPLASNDKMQNKLKEIQEEDDEGQHGVLNKEAGEEHDVDGLIEEIGSLDQAGLLRKSSDVEKALEELEKESSSPSNAATQKKLSSLKERGEELEERMKNPKPQETLTEVVKDMDYLQDEVSEVEDAICMNYSSSIASKFRQAFEISKRAMRAVLGTPMPILGIRGYSASAFGVQAGLEQVIDLRNREIGSFRFGSLGVGSASVGASIGGYAGVGWKGYKENFTLEVAYQTGLWKSIDVSATAFGYPVGLGVTVCTDADNSQGPVWIPEPNGINSVLFGWSASLSVADPFITKYNWGAVYDVMMNSECFDSTAELVKSIWIPWRCPHCAPGAERIFVSALRASFAAGTMMWPIPELAYTTLAYLYDQVRKGEDYQPQCSSTSMNYRNDPQLFVLQTAKLLYETVELAENLEKTLNVLTTRLNLAQLWNTEFQQANELQEVIKSFKASGYFCRKVPLDFTGAEERMKFLSAQSEDDLKELCDRYGLSEECKKTKHKEKVYVRVALYLSLESGELTFQELSDIVLALQRENRYKGSSLWTASRRMQKIKRSCQERTDFAGDVGCSTGLKLARYLQKMLDEEELYNLCGVVHVNCHQWKDGPKLQMCKASSRVTGSKCARWDPEMMSFLISNKLGGAELDRADSDNPFGRCDTDVDCQHSPHMVCKQQKGYDHYSAEQVKRCACAENFCHDSRTTNGVEQDYCKAQGSDWFAVFRDINSFHLSKRIALGKMIGFLARLTDNSIEQEEEGKSFADEFAELSSF
mmetsp:Transcript_16592/g.29033  ORF Transcript_16592/g.29033 Transcript_16592/m.29033 type:complete len:1177 (-) Transcript_16592:220-3750(-)|eukprot:CAMPEP_0197635492 /NCGR_PEP_ID=MMETSP1338-20131121/11286_1 /TAXON_ID=43686 ORGANISM="Pelagodinium beii, Strain RCC1491" /NCGR_SAMPLE_ID=MMETSP1338 /ASSEMBLY_ACC=CAM_ASM_000754 /LENGTH=1176 /DNA_ID=CAMNT_0043207553 /DNA_START=106 /DNA_END=3636 /DNA_ORIENTATION=-